MIRLLLVASLFAPTVAEARIIDRIVAVVNDAIITWSELEDVARPILAQVANIHDPVEREQTRDRQLRVVLDDLVGQKLIMQEAQRRQIRVDSRDVDAHLNRIKERQGWDEERFKVYLAGQGVSLTEFRKQVQNQLLRQRIVRRVLGTRIQVSERELKDFYKEQSTQKNADYEVEAAHILLKVPNEATPAEEAALSQKAKELLARAQGGEDFAGLAQQYSEGPRAADGGSLGLIRRGNLDPNLEQAFFDLEPGAVGGPVRTAFGFHVIKSVSRKSLPPPAYDEWVAEGTRLLREKKLAGELSRWVAELKKKAFIEVRL